MPKTEIEKRIAELIRIRSDIDRELRELASGRSDAEASGNFYPSMALPFHEVESGAAILNAMPANIAMLDSRGVIVAVNDSWQRFASINSLHGIGSFVGQDYLAVCERVQGPGSEEALKVAEGIRQVLRAERKEFTLDYPCHSPEEKRWFRLMVVPAVVTRQAGAVVIHLNITEKRLAEEAKWAAEGKYQSIFENAVEGIFQSTPEGRYITIKPAFARIHGYDSPEEMMRLCTDIAKQVYTDPRDRDEVKRLIGARGEALNFEHQSYRKDGTTAWVSLNARLVKDSGGGIHYEGSIVDITERKKADIELTHRARNLVAIVEVQRFLATTDAGVAELIGRIASIAAKLFEADGATFEVIEGGTLILRSLSGQAAGLADKKLKADGSLAELVLNTGHPVICDPAETDARPDVAACARLQVASIIATALPGKVTPIGVIKVMSRQKGYFTDEDKRCLQLAAETLGTSLQRKHAEEMLINSEREYRRLSHELTLETRRLQESQAVANVGGWETDLISLKVTWTDETFRIFETSPDLFHPTHSGFLEFVHPDDRAAVDAAFVQSIGKSGIFSIDHRLVMANQRIKFVEERWQTFNDAAGKPLRAVGTCRDMTARKIAELEIVRTNRALKLLSSCGESLIRAENEDQLLRAICQLATDTGGYRMAWVGYAQRDPRHSIKPMASAGEETGYLTEINLSWSEEEESGNGPAGRTIRSGTACLCEDIECDPGFRWLESARKRGYRSVICLPLRDEGRVFGLLGLYSSEVTRANDAELKLLQELADDLAFGIINLRARIERQKLQEAVLAIARGVSASFGQEFFQKLNQHIVEALQADVGFIALLELPDRQYAHTVSVISTAGEADNFRYRLEGSPCEHVARGETFLVECELQKRYPGNAILAEFRMDAFAATPLINTQSETVGSIAVLFRQPIIQKDFVTSTLRIFAARAASEMERQRSDLQVREQASLLDAAHDAILVKDLDDKIIFWNKGAERLYGWTAEEALGRSSQELLFHDSVQFKNSLEELFANGNWDGEQTKLTKSGREIIVKTSWTLVRGANGQPKSVLAINSDVTEKKKLEAQFFRAQRMESIGVLAGGIAHDLNNVLSPILMSVELLKFGVNAEDRAELLETMRASAQRGADLVKQVLSYARGIEGQSMRIDLAYILKEIRQIVRETFPKNIVFTVDIATDLWTITGDPTQLHQVLMNLCVNARDAMPHGGLLTASLKNENVDEVYAGMNPETKCGSYVSMSVRDTGTGIPPEIRDKIFDPFFTTKELGKGTGLGLSTTMSIVKSHGGFIDVTSEPGKGTMFTIHLPANRDSEITEESKAKVQPPAGKGELLLFVDDEEGIREVAKKYLKRFGYRVLLASNGAEAVSTYSLHSSEISAVITDMAMPVMDGRACAVALKSLNPQVLIIGSSGMANREAIAKIMECGVCSFISKPYTSEAMLIMIRQVLDGRVT